MKQEKLKKPVRGYDFMLNTFLIVSCDQCGQQFDRLSLSFTVSQNTDAISCMTDLLQQDGWHVFHEIHSCPDCVLAGQINSAKTEHV
jgi:hypothetical protein